MSTASAKNGSPIEARAGEEPEPMALTYPVPGLHEDQGLLLAQIPNLDPKVNPKVSEKRIDGRIISQALSIKLVFGVGIGLVIGSILPFLFGRVNRPEARVTELPAWTTGGGSTAVTSQTTAPTWPSLATAPSGGTAPPQTPSAPPPAIVSPQAPQIGDARPNALAEPAWPAPRSSGALAPARTPSSATSNYVNPPVAGTNPLDNRGAYREFDRRTDWPNTQADSRNDPAAQYRSNDTRYAYPPATPPGGTTIPPGTSGPGASYREPPISEPGVARFEGTIASPPIR